MRARLRAWGIPLVIFLFCEVFFLIRLQVPSRMAYDETYYVSAARNLLKLEKNSNPEHPPLGKILIASGMAIGGDQAKGWRLASTVAGSFTVVAVFLIA